jgi:hypothetical protein
VEEYTYEPPTFHLSDAEAAERYRQASATKAGDTIVSLDLHDCGHWTVKELKTEAEREAYLKGRLQSIVAQFFNVFSR